MIEINKPNWFQKLIIGFVKTRIGTAIMQRILHPMDRFVFKISKKKYTFGSIMSGLPIVILECKGAKSGKLYNIPLVAIPIENDIGLIASNWGQTHFPSWYYNVKGHPEVKITYKKNIGDYTALEIEGEEKEKYWDKANTIYPGYNNYAKKAGRNIPVIKLTPAV